MGNPRFIHTQDRNLRLTNMYDMVARSLAEHSLDRQMGRVRFAVIPRQSRVKAMPAALSQP